MSDFFKNLGCTFLMTGTCRGGGMLAVPIVTVHCHYLLVPILIVLVAFGSHFIIPSIRNYIDSHSKRLRKIIFIGMLIPLLAYII